MTNAELRSPPYIASIGSLIFLGACAIVVEPTPLNAAGDPIPEVGEVGSTCSPIGDWHGDNSARTLIVADDIACTTGNVCVAYELVGDPNPDCEAGCARPEEVDARLFCSCRCDGEPGDEPLCQCPSGFSCAPVLDIGHLAGSYCIPEGIAPASE